MTISDPARRMRVVTRPDPLVQIGGARTSAQPVGRLPVYSLRISLLEQCQLRCGYCMPGDGRPYTDKCDWLSLEEHGRLAPLDPDQREVHAREHDEHCAARYFREAHERQGQREDEHEGAGDQRRAQRRSRARVDHAEERR